MSIVPFVVGGVLGAGVLVMLPTLKTVSRVAPFAYPSARARTMRSRLLKNEDFHGLLKRSYTDVVYELQQFYPHLAGHLGADVSFTQLDRSLRAELVETLVQIRRMCPEDTKRFVEALLAKYDVQVIESIVRGQGAVANRRTETLHPTETFSEAFITKETITLENLYNELKGTAYADIIDEYRDEIERHDLENFEVALDLLYLKELLHAAKTRESRGYAQFLIDSHNISLALKGKQAIIPGGKISLEELGNSKSQTIIDAAQKAGYNISGQTPQQIEKSMRVGMKRYAEALMARDPLSEAPIISLLILKQITQRNVTILLRLKAAGLEDERIQEALVL